MKDDACERCCGEEPGPAELTNDGTAEKVPRPMSRSFQGSAARRRTLGVDDLDERLKEGHEQPLALSPSEPQTIATGTVINPACETAEMANGADDAVKSATPRIRAGIRSASGPTRREQQGRKADDDAGRGGGVPLGKFTDKPDKYERRCQAQ